MHGRQRLVALFGVSLALTLLVLVGYGLHALRPLELSSVDARFRIRDTDAPPKSVVLVKIDDVTFNDLGLRWPFPRDVHARLTDVLRRAGARVIAFDVSFTEPSANPEEDNALIRSVGRAGNVVLATTEVDDRGRTRIFGGDQVLRQIHARPGNTTLPVDSGGVYRRFDFKHQDLKSFSVVAAERATGKAGSASDFTDRGTAWIDYRGPPDTIRSIPFSRALRGQAPPGFFRGKIVVIGATAPSLQDVHPSPTDGTLDMPGPEIQANAISTVLRDFPLKRPGGVLEVALILLLGLITALASVRLSPMRAFGVALAAGGLYVVTVQLAFNAGLIVPFVYPMLALSLSSIGALGVNFLAASFERERVRDNFGRFVSDAVAEQVIDQSDGKVTLGGRRVESTVLFSDLRGFTSFAESLPPERVVAILNRYLGSMSDAVLNESGTLVSYMGDGIMAVFGAPIESDDHADRALAAARDMLSRLEKFNAWMESEGLGAGFKMGIGLNTGEVMSGTVGSERRLEYTTIGDTVNTASRLEGMTKGTPYQLFLAEATRSDLAIPADDLVYVDELSVRGRQATVKIWALKEESSAPISQSPL
jgi:adenylate cyclase